MWTWAKARPRFSILLLLGALGGLVAFFYREPLLALAAWVLKWLELYLQHTHPVIYFSLMAVLPALGVPMLIFYVTAGFYPIAVAIPGAAVAIALNLILSYVLATRLLRPLGLRLLASSGWKVPHLEKGDYYNAGLMLRFAPGLPMFLQSTLMALAGLPLRQYLLISWPVQMGWCLGAIFLGRSLFEGEIGLAVTGALLLLCLVFGFRFLKNRYGRARVTPPAPPAA